MSLPPPNDIAAGVSPDKDLNGLAGQVIDQLGAQRDLPRLPVPEGWRIGPFSLNLPDVVLFVVLLACVGIVAYVILRFRRANDAAWDARAAEEGAGAQQVQANLARAEVFAAAGRYTEAMHELLLQCVSDLRRRGAGRLDESLTSREILRKAVLLPAGRDALEGIVSRVEQTYFGLQPADVGLWLECRARFDLVCGASDDG